jgi:TolB-like protein/DNA-binding winged helix-turn-helix (wHTH) protein/thioredoxin-like negative regulator of GroEL
MQRLDESTIYVFEDFRLDTKNHRLTRINTNAVISLTPRVAELLIYMARNAGRVLSKHELLEAVWENAFVEESNLSQSIFVLRKALGDDTKNPRFILTAPNRGYEFIAKVAERGKDDETPEDGIFSEGTKFEVPSSGTRISKPNRPRQGIRLFGLVVPLILAVTVGIYWFYAKPKPTKVSEIKTIAILPFEDLSADKGEKYLGVSLADTLVNKFGSLSEITVRPTRSVLKYAEGREDVGKVGRELQVDAVLDGRIQRVGERMRISVQLIRISDNATIWTEQFDDQFTNFFAVQDSISQKVVQSLALQMNERERERFSRRGTENAEAYQDYLRGIFFLNKRINDNLPKAARYFEQAIQKDPNFALAHAGLANSYLIMPEYAATSTLESFPLARKHVTKALELDAELGEAHAILAGVNAEQNGDVAETEKELQRAIELSPNFMTAHRWYAANLRRQGRYEESLAELKRARELDPSAPEVMINIAQTYKILGNYDAAIAQLNEGLSFNPDHAITHDELARVLYKKGLYAEALPESLKAVDLSNRLHTLLVTLAEIYIKLGEHGKASDVIKELEEKYPGAASYYIAMLYSESGNKEKMFSWLERAMKEKPRCLVELKDEPHFSPYRSEPRFQDLVRRIGY